MRNRRILLIGVSLIFLLIGYKLTTSFDPQSTVNAAATLINGQESGIESAPEAYFEQMKELLNLTETGRTALALMAEYEIGLEFDGHRGTIYHVPSNTMIIDSGQDPVWAAINFVHEVHHARYLHQGLRADIHELNRDRYVQQKIDEEATGIVASIEFKTELGKAGVAVFDFHYPLEKAYRESYLVAVKEALAQDGDLSAEELMAIGKEAGTARIVAGLLAGEVVRSNGEMPYPEFFARDWGKANILRPLRSFVGSLADTVVN